MEILAKYLRAFSKIKRGVTKYGKAPHKIILLLSVLQFAKNNKFISNQIFITPELIMLFKSNWSALVKTEHVCNFALPFWHLKGDKFWKLIAKPGFESGIMIKESVSGLNELNAMVDYAVLDNELYQLINHHESNDILRAHLLDLYFPDFGADSVSHITYQTNVFDEIENKILHEKPSDYRAEIKKLLEEKNEEEIFIRGSIFKREVPKIYDYTCSITSHRIETISNITMIDACHIRPFSESFDDTISNGIALCPNLHRAFDRGLISIDSDYKVLVSSNFHENRNAFSLRGLEGKQILLPKDEKFYPSQKNLEWHRTIVFKS